MTAADTPDGFDSDIAVVGMAGRFAGAATLEAYWRNLRDGVESIESFSEEQLAAAGVDPDVLADPQYVRRGAVLPDMEMFDPAFFGLSPREGSIMDPQHRHFLECSWEALEDAGHVPERFEGSIGVFAGSGHNAYMPYNLMSNPKLMDSVGFFLVRHTGNDKDFLTTRLSYALNLRGPSVNVQTACSTSLVAIHMAAQSLLNRECDMALAGGVTIELPHRHGYLYKDGEILSPDGHCHSFDADSKGTVFSSGVGVVVLRRLSDAIADGDHIHAVIKGSAVNNDGSGKVGYLAPSVDGQAQAIAEAISLSGVAADTITLVEAHGTGTPVGDPIEVSALTQAFRQTTDGTGFCAIGSVKSNIGHCDTAAGVAAFIKVALALENAKIPPSINFSAPNPACRFEHSPFFVNQQLRDWVPPPGVPRRAGVSSLGVGGTNAHVVLEEAPHRKAGSPSRDHQLVVVSGRTPTALRGNLERLASHLEANPQVPLADVSHTLQVGRRAMAHRRVVAVSDVGEAIAALRDPTEGPTRASAVAEDLREVAFMFAGGGAQHPHMGADLYRAEPTYRAVVDEGLAHVLRFAGLDLRPLLMPEPGQEAAAAKSLEQPSRALPALLMVQVAQARLWMSWGVEPAAMIGHSMGEYTAAHLAGVFSFEDALRLVHERGRLFESLPVGAMLSVPMGRAELEPMLPASLSIAALNGPRLTVVAGPVADVEALQARLLQDHEVESARVRISVAAHSQMLEPILGPFGDFLRTIRMQAPKRRFVSNLSGTWITALEASSADYWVRHLRQTVRFADGLQVLLDDTGRLLLELGPGRTLSSLARQHPARDPRQPVLNASRHADEAVSDQAFALTVLGRLWAHGLDVDWSKLRPGERRLRVRLPAYAFDHQRLWIDPGVGPAAALPAADRPLTRRRDAGDWTTVPSWVRRPLNSPEIAPQARPPAIVFADGTGFGDRLAAALVAQGRSVTVVRPGTRFARKGPGEFALHPGNPLEYEQLLGALGVDAASPLQVFHAWMVTGAQAPGEDFKTVDQWLPLGFYSLMYLAQALGAEDWSGPVGLLVLSDGMQRVAGEAEVHPVKATVLGPCRVIPAEIRAVRCRSIDLEAGMAPDWVTRRVVEDVLAEADAMHADDAVVALRSGERWVLERTPQPLKPAAQRLPWRQRGVYLITGGLGGVGLAIARRLAAKVPGVQLELVGRSPVPAPQSWDGWLREHDADDTTSRRIRELRAIQALGAQVVTHAVDIADAGRMQAVIADIRRRCGALHGVLHAAGVLHDAPIQLKDPGEAAAVLSPKLQGTLALEAALEATGAAPGLDFLVLLSSVSAFAGFAGQVDYAAANAFLDAFAQSRARRSQAYCVAIDWSQWAEVGMAAELGRRLGLSAEDSLPSPGAPGTTVVGHPLVGHRLRRSDDESVYQTAFAIETHWLLAEHRVRDGDALIPGTGFLEIVRACRAVEDSAGPFSLREVSFLAPFSVRDAESRDLRVTFKRLGPDAAASAFVVKARDPGEPGGWLECVRGETARLDDSPPAPVALDALRARCAVDVPVDPARQPAHLQFGPRWANVQQLGLGDGEALVTLELPPSHRDDLSVYRLHPALLDMATAGAQCLLPGFDDQRDFFVPSSYGELRSWGPLPARVFSHVRLRTGGEDAPGTARVAVYDVTLCDAQGQVCVEVRDFAMIRVHDKALLARDATTSATATSVRSVANPLLALGLQEGIRPDEGLDVIERVLAWRPGPQVAASPHDLEVLLARLRAAEAPSDAAEPKSQPDDPNWRAPNTPMEKLIAHMWAELLGQDRVSANGNFFDLGGHSLLAVQVINRLRKRTGKSLPLTALLQAPTVESLAALIEPAGTTTADSTDAGTAAGAPARRTSAVPATVVPIRPGQDGPPLFFVHDGKGETLLYRTLALSLDAGWPVYGLQPLQADDGSFAHTRIRDMAAHHVAQVRSLQPEGPYYLTGLCAGGVIAFEMARQLQEVGQTTAYVGIIDAADVHAEERRFRIVKERLQRFVGTLSADPKRPLLGRVGSAIPEMIHKAVNAARWEISTRLARRRTARRVEALRAGHADADAVAGAPMPSPIDFLPLYEVAHRQHQPQGQFHGGDVVLFRATRGDGSVADVPYAEVYTDPLLGWQPRVVEPVIVRDVPGGHSSALQEPNVRVLADAMRETLRAARARHVAARATAQAATTSLGVGTARDVVADRHPASRVE
jgi:acyl transferase domain-containing protein/thioesterase domain-containing protein/acyl carrier protein